MTSAELETLTTDEVFCLAHHDDVEPTKCWLRQVIITKEFKDGQFKDTIKCHLEVQEEIPGIRHSTLPLEEVFVSEDSFYEYLRTFIDDQITATNASLEDWHAKKTALATESILVGGIAEVSK